MYSIEDYKAALADVVVDNLRRGRVIHDQQEIIADLQRLNQDLKNGIPGKDQSDQ
jgi:hypothetical protein